MSYKTCLVILNLKKWIQMISFTVSRWMYIVRRNWSYREIMLTGIVLKGYFGAMQSWMSSNWLLTCKLYAIILKKCFKHPFFQQSFMRSSHIHLHPYSSLFYLLHYLPPNCFDRHICLLHFLLSPSDKRHVDWVHSYLSIWTEMQSFIKQHHTTGLVWSKTVSRILS